MSFGFSYLHLILVALLTSSLVSAQNISATEDAVEIRSMAIDGNTMYAGTALKGVYISTDGGGKWTPYGTGLPEKWEISSIVAAGGAVLVQAHDDLSSNRNEMWIKHPESNVWVQLFKEKAFNGGPRHQMANFKGRFFVATRNNGLWESLDNGKQWSQVAGMENTEVEILAENGRYLIGKVYSIDPLSMKMTADGVTWQPLKSSSLVSPEKLETHGKYIITRQCNSQVSQDDLVICRNEIVSVFNEKKKRFEDPTMNARYFGFDGDNIYAVTVAIKKIKKKLEAEYIRKFYKSDDGGVTWTEIDSITDEFVSTDPHLKAKIEEFDATKEEELAYANRSIVTAHLGAQKMREMKAARRRATGAYVPSGGNYSGSSTDYRSLSNDRFKERYNHRDSWIDSKGQIHSN